MKLSRFKKTLIVIIIMVIGLVILLDISLNLSLTHRLITQKINKILLENHLPLHISSVRIILPKSVTIKGVSLTSPGGDTIIYAEEVKASFIPSAAINKKILLSSVFIGDCRISITRNNWSNQLNIAEAFSGIKQTQVTPTVKKKKSWEVSIGNAELSEIRIHIQDSISGLNIDQNIGKIMVEIEKMSMPEKIIFIKSLEIDRATGKISLDQHQGDKTISSSNSDWNIGLGKLILNKIDQNFNDRADKMLMNVILWEALIKINNSDLKSKVINFDKISVSETSLIMLSDSQPDRPDGTKTGIAGTFPWAINGNNLEFENVALRTGSYSDSTANTFTPGFSISKLNLSLADIKINDAEAALIIKKTSFDLDNGFSLKKLEGNLDSHSGEIKLKLSAETGNSVISLEGSADQNIFNILKNPFTIGKVVATINNTSLSINDLFYFKPELKEKPLFASLASKPFIIEGVVSLHDTIITFSKFEINQDHNFDITLDGKISNIFYSVNLLADLQFAIPDISTEWINKTLKESGFKKDMPAFGKLSLYGSLSDSLSLQHFNIILKSDLGNINLSGLLDLTHDSFSSKTSFDKLALNKLLGNKELGIFYGSVDIYGRGIKQKAIVADGIILIDSLHFKDYTYTKTRIECKVKQNNYDFRLVTDDPSLHWDLISNVRTVDSVLFVKVNGNFSSQLNNLHLYKDTLAVEGTINASFQKYSGNIKSDVNISALKLSTAYNSTTVSKIEASLIADSLSTSLKAESDFFNLDVHIGKPLSAAGTILVACEEYAGSFINRKNLNADKSVSFLPEMKATVKIYPKDELRILLQDTTINFTNLSLLLNVNPVNSKLSCELLGRDFRYKYVKIGNLNINVSDSAGILNMNTAADNCTLFSLPVNKILLTNRTASGLGLTSVSILGQKDKLLYNFELRSIADSNGLALSIPSKQLTLNEIAWKLETSDLFYYNRISKSFSSSLKIQTTNSSLNIHAGNEEGINIYKVSVNNLTLASLLPNGIISGNPAVSLSGSADYSVKENHSMEINSDLKFKDIKWHDLIISNISLTEKYKSSNPEEYSLNAVASIDSSQITLRAVKMQEGKRSINAEFNNLPIRTFQPFVKDIVSDLKGYITGNFNVITTDEIENFNGELDINKANVRINTLNSNYTIPEERISFTGGKMVFNKFRVLDSLNNELLVDGSLDFNKSKSVSTDLEITSSKLQVMNRTEKENSSFYGNIYIDTHLFIKGPISNPDFKGKIILTGGTEIFLNQQENLSLTESEKVVTFIKKNPSGEQERSEQTVNPNLFSKTAIEAVVEIDPATKLNISLSKKLYDISIMIQGGGELNFNMLENNQVNLAGKYVIGEGTANIKMTGWPNKTFYIIKGGYIRWDGKLEDPELQLEAVNKVRSSYTNPIDNKQRDVDFNVTFKLSNKLSNLDVLFGINTPDQYLMSIINTLSPEEQMRQAITILLFAKIDLPGISTSSDYMTEQVNQLVATQLNQLTKTTIKGIDISFGLDSYMQSNQTGGQETKTSLSYDVKKALFNNRAQIEISGRLNDVNKQPGASDLSLNNFSFLYRLDSTGRKFLKVYNEHTYEDVFEGEIIKTGVGLTYRKRYKTLGDIWRKEDKKNKQKIQDK
jgi:translocation and assembly module TamB